VAEGARVAITGRNKTTLDAAAKELGHNLLAFRADVLDSKARELVFNEIKMSSVTWILSLPTRASENSGRLQKHLKNCLMKFCGQI
jgi:NAD(P)-dependent dehydrogenase (short-subunit alcohol dehydrogenase family)